MGAYPGQGGSQEFGPRAGVAPQPAYPLGPRFGRRVQSRRQLWMWVRVGLALFVFLGMPLLLLGTGAYHSYAYSVGTPATATNVKCIKHGRASQSCTGT